MTRKFKKETLIHENCINENIKYINDSKDYYISENGNVYRKYNNGYYKLKPIINHGYCLVGIEYNNKRLQQRIHRLVAENFIYNDDPVNKTIVMHIDNNKCNNCVSNLKWGTVSENTKQAFDDGLIKNDIGFDDSQSKPVILLDYNTYNKINIYGSICQASKLNNIQKAIIYQQCHHLIKHPEKQRKYKFYFRFLEEYNKYGFVL